MIKLELAFVSFLKKELAGYELVDSAYLNLQIAFSLLVSLAYIPGNSILNQLYWLDKILEYAFTYTLKQRQSLLKLILKVGPFRLHEQIPETMNIIAQIFSQADFTVDSSENPLQEIVREDEAQRRTLYFAEEFTKLFINQPVVVLDLSSKIPQKSLIVEQTGTYPYILSGLFERFAQRELFPQDSNAQIPRFPAFVPLPTSQEELFRLPSTFNAAGVKKRQGINKGQAEAEQEQEEEVKEKEEQLEQNQEEQEQDQQESFEENKQDFIEEQPEEDEDEDEEKSIQSEHSQSRREIESPFENNQIIADNTQEMILSKEKFREEIVQKEGFINQDIERVIPSNSFPDNNEVQQLPASEFKAPQTVRECIEYYESVNRNYAENEKHLKNVNNPELVSALKAHFQNIYEVCFKAALLDCYISEIEDDSLIPFFELHLIQLHLEASSSRPAAFFSGVQVFPLISVLLLQLYGRKSFYALLIGKLASTLPTLWDTNAFYFQVSELNPTKLYNFIALQILFLVDSSSYFLTHIHLQKDFLPKYIALACANKDLHYKFSLEKELAFPVTNNAKQQKTIQNGYTLQVKIREDYFKLVRNSRYKLALQGYLISIQKVCNYSGIYLVEKLILQDANNQPASKKNQEEQEPSLTQRMKTRKEILQKYSPKYLSQQDTKELLQCDVDASLVDLEAEFSQKLDSLNEEFFVKNFNSLGIRQSQKSPQFVLGFLPESSTVQDFTKIKRDVQNQIEKIQEMIDNEMRQSEINKAKQLIPQLFVQKYGDRLGGLISEILETIFDNWEEIINYFDVLFYESLRQTVNSDQP